MEKLPILFCMEGMSTRIKYIFINSIGNLGLTKKCDNDMLDVEEK